MVCELGKIAAEYFFPRENIPREVTFVLRLIDEAKSLEEKADIVSKQIRGIGGVISPKDYNLFLDKLPPKVFNEYVARGMHNFWVGVKNYGVKDEGIHVDCCNACD